MVSLEFRCNCYHTSNEKIHSKNAWKRSVGNPKLRKFTCYNRIY